MDNNHLNYRDGSCGCEDQDGTLFWMLITEHRFGGDFLVVTCVHGLTGAPEAAEMVSAARRRLGEMADEGEGVFDFRLWVFRTSGDFVYGATLKGGATDFTMSRASLDAYRRALSRYYDGDTIPPRV